MSINERVEKFRNHLDNVDDPMAIALSSLSNDRQFDRNDNFAIATELIEYQLITFIDLLLDIHPDPDHGWLEIEEWLQSLPRLL